MVPLLSGAAEVSEQINPHALTVEQWGWKQQEQQPVLGIPTTPELPAQSPGWCLRVGRWNLWVKRQTSSLWLVMCCGSAAVTRQRRRETSSHCPVNTSLKWQQRLMLIAFFLVIFAAESTWLWKTHSYTNKEIIIDPRVGQAPLCEESARLACNEQLHVPFSLLINFRESHQISSYSTCVFYDF